VNILNTLCCFKNSGFEYTDIVKRGDGDFFLKKVLKKVLDKSLHVVFNRHLSGGVRVLKTQSQIGLYCG